MPVEWLQVEVVFAAPELQRAVVLEVPAGTTIRGVLERSRILETLPAASDLECGIFGARQPLDTVVRAGDRIEIYRPLAVDPKLMRRRRAAPRVGRR